ncbi:Protein CBG17520 [Caenorhabditis briggsae]|uniref:Protein CBG17520 n=1 Tax=Caenorhabditis briggsae TaxID=6238 RepID=A8XRD5_CAEBR|nr:Protein CBG17520 [Caenorhabditis briggsae]CAP35154.2 Protein CBG17520 [Caenorhabditis briggsae]
MTSVSFGGSDSRFQSLDRAPGYSDGASGFADIEDEENDIIDLDEESYEYLTNTYFRAGHDGCDEYTSLTTFHGMIRVFNSRNCPSLIFWCLVVTTCLVFYIMVCGAMIKSYSTQPSFLRINETKNVQFDTMIELCSEEKMKCYEIAREKEQMKCKEIDAHCVSIRFSTKTKIRLKKKETFSCLILEIFQIQRLNLDRAQCVSNWHEIPWIPEDSKPDYHYSLKLCERLRYELTGKVEYLQYDFPCQPACLESQYKVSNSKLFHNSESVAITFSVFPVVTYMEETRQKTLVDILCKQSNYCPTSFLILCTGFLGGASSLFMGCSCVTLMEMFVFLFKLVTNSVCSDEPPEPDDSFYEEKFRFEFSDHRNKRRYAICDRETMEKYLLSNNRNREDLKEESSASPKDEYSVDYHDEKMDTVGEIPVENKRLLRPPLRRCSTATSYASHTSKGSSSLTTRSFAQVSQNRRMSRAFTRNMPMNDF